MKSIVYRGEQKTDNIAIPKLFPSIGFNGFNFVAIPMLGFKFLNSLFTRFTIQINTSDNKATGRDEIIDHYKISHTVKL